MYSTTTVHSLRLDATAVGARNFTSLHEAFSLLSQCTPDGAISIRVAGAKDHTLDATDAATLALVKTLADKLAAAKVKMTFSNEAQRTYGDSGCEIQIRFFICIVKVYALTMIKYK